MAKTIKKSKDHKTDLVRDIREAIEMYTHVYVFSVNNMRNTRLKDLRTHWNTSRYVIVTKLLALRFPLLLPLTCRARVIDERRSGSTSARTS
jgi:hypothetical protein